MYEKTSDYALLPHNVNVFTTFLAQPDRINDFLTEQGKLGIPNSILSNEADVYTRLIESSEPTVTVILQGPDSINVIEQSLTDKTKERSELYQRFGSAYNRSCEILSLLHYDGLVPNKKYTSGQLKGILTETAEKIDGLLQETKEGLRLRNWQGISPYTLTSNYRWVNPRKVDSQFPLAGKFYDTGIFKQIIGRKLEEDVIADREVTDEEIIKLIQKFPGAFSENPLDAYGEALTSIDAKVDRINRHITF